METIEIIAEMGIAILILSGALMSALSAFGLIRLPDVYLRSHAATKSATLGVLFILLGVFLYFMIILEHTSAKLLLGIAFVFITAPVAGHLNGRAAYRTGVSMWKGSVRDDLKEAFEQEEDRKAKANMEGNVVKNEWHETNRQGRDSGHL